MAELEFSPAVLLENPGSIVWEPGLRADGRGRVFVTAFVAHLWRSLDGGATFEAMGEPSCDVPFPVCPPSQGRRDTGLVSGSDGALDIDATGRLHWAGLGGSLQPPPAVPYQFSDDGGQTWSSPIDLANGNDTDRQWLVVGPKGEVLVVWRDSGARVADPLRQGTGPPQLMLSVSRDGGASWDGPRSILGHDPIPGPLVVDRQSGTLYLPLADNGVSVLRSLDGGTSWKVVPIPGAGDPLFVFPWAAVDDAGTLYVAWATADPPLPAGLPVKTLEVPRVYLTVSRDAGSTWSDPLPLSPENRPAVMPTLVAGAAGRVAVAWYEGTQDLPSEHAQQEWHVTVVEAAGLNGPAPTFVRGRATPTPALFGAICTGGTTCSDLERSRGDFFEITLLPDGQPILAFVQDRVPGGAGGQAVDVAVVRVQGTPLR